MQTCQSESSILCLWSCPAMLASNSFFKFSQSIFFSCSVFARLSCSVVNAEDTLPAPSSSLGRLATHPVSTPSSLSSSCLSLFWPMLSIKSFTSASHIDSLRFIYILLECCWNNGCQPCFASSNLWKSASSYPVWWTSPVSCCWNICCQPNFASSNLWRSASSYPDWSTYSVSDFLKVSLTSSVLAGGFSLQARLPLSNFGFFSLWSIFECAFLKGKGMPDESSSLPPAPY